MAIPTVGDIRKLRRLSRYFIGKLRVIWEFKFQGECEELHGYSDSYWAGCKRIAKSTSGGAVMRGAHCLKTWAATQKSITLSSGEAELVAAVKMSTELIGMLQLSKEWNLEMEGVVFMDSSAALGIVKRKGNGKMRHIRVGMLWIQQKAEEDELKFKKVDGKENPGDLMTKHVPQAVAEKLCRAVSLVVRGGRASSSLRV